MLKLVLIVVLCCGIARSADSDDAAVQAASNPFLSRMKNLLSFRKPPSLEVTEDPTPATGVCFPTPCENYGMCAPVGVNDYRCNCINPLYTGKNCEYLACITVPWPSVLSFLPQPFYKECPVANEVCALKDYLPQCVCEDSTNCP